MTGRTEEKTKVSLAFELVNSLFEGLIYVFHFEMLLLNTSKVIYHLFSVDVVMLEDLLVVCKLRDIVSDYFLNIRFYYLHFFRV